MSIPNNTKKTSSSKFNLLVVYFIFATLSLIYFYGRAEFYSLLPEIIEISEVLFGEPATTTYQGNTLMPNNNQTAYFVSNYTTKSSGGNYSNRYATRSIYSSYQYAYHIPSTNNDISSNPPMIVFQNSMFSPTTVIRKRNQQEISNTYNYGNVNFKIFQSLAPFQSNLASAQIADNETTSTLFSTSNNEPFRISQTDPDPEEPEGSVLPLGNDLAILLLLAGMYAFVKFRALKGV